MKIAFATQDQQRVDAHFGWAKHLAVYEIDASGHRFVQTFPFGEDLAEDGNEDKLAPKLEAIKDCATNGTEEWASKVQALFDASPYGAGCKAYPKRDLWHMRSLLYTEPVDFLIGNTYGKYLERDTGTPLIRMVFPIFDRHHYHRYPIWGYDGGLRTLIMFLDEFFETLDANTIVPAKTDYSYDIIR